MHHRERKKRFNPISSSHPGAPRGRKGAGLFCQCCHPPPGVATTSHVLKLGLTRMLLHPPSSLLTCSVETYAADGPPPHSPRGQAIAHPKTCLGWQGEGRTSTAEGKAGQEGDWRGRGSSLGKFLQPEDMPSLVLWKPSARPANGERPSGHTQEDVQPPRSSRPPQEGARRGQKPWQVPYEHLALHPPLPVHGDGM